MKVFVVLYEHYLQDHSVEVIGVYLDEERANNRVLIERGLIEVDPDNKFRDECWYQECEVIA